MGGFALWFISWSLERSKQPNLAESCRVRLSRLLYWTGVFFLLSFKTCLRNECSQCHHQLFFYPPDRFMLGRPMSLVGRFDTEFHFFDKLDKFDNFVFFTNNTFLVLQWLCCITLKEEFKILLVTLIKRQSYPMTKPAAFSSAGGGKLRKPR